MTKDKIRKLKRKCNAGLFGPFEFEYTEDKNQPHKLISKHGINVLELLAWDIPNLILEYEKLQTQCQVLQAQNTGLKNQNTPVPGENNQDIYKVRIDQCNRIIALIKEHSAIFEPKITSTPDNENDE